MNVKIEDLSSVKKKISVEIPWDEVKKELDAAYKDIGKKAKIKGFRPGKIPRKILESYFKNEAELEAATNMVNKYYWQALDERGIVPVSRPEIHQEGIKENEKYLFSASFEIEPEFEPKGYRNMSLEREDITVSDDDVRHRIDEIRQLFATVHDVSENRPVVSGDYVVIDFEGSLEGDKPKELKADDFFLEIGSGKLVQGFEEQLLGMQKGETKEFQLTFPHDYYESKFAGKEVVFKVTVKNLREKKLPESDEDLVKNFEKYKSFEEFQEDVRKSLEEKARRFSKENLQKQITDQLIRENDFEVPSTLVERQILYLMSDTQARMVSAGIDEQSAMDFAMKMKDKYKEDAERTVKSFIILKQIAKKEAIVAQDDEVETYLQELARQSGRDYSALKKNYDDEDRRDYLKMDIIQKKVIDFIERNANIKTIEKKGFG